MIKNLRRLRQAAYHEAGHFVVARHFGHLGECVALYIDASGVVGYWAPAGNPADALAPFEQAMVLYAGSAAQARISRCGLAATLLGSGQGDLERLRTIPDHDGAAAAAVALLRTLWGSVELVAAALESTYRYAAADGHLGIEIPGWRLGQIARLPGWYDEVAA